jgi:fumarate reductase flavoprotein subunit
MHNRRVSGTSKNDADVIVIGAGGTGLAAAVAAAERGARVTLLEKHSPGGNTAMAMGLLAADSPLQKRMCLSATTDEVFRMAMEYSHWRIDPRIVRAFVNKSGDTIRWLEEKGLELKELPSMFPGQTFRTWHCIDALKATGPALVKTLRKSCEDLGVRLLTRCPARKLLVGEKGAVLGVLAEREGREMKLLAKSVVIATGGYGGSKDLLKKYFPAYEDTMRYWGTPHVTGDGLLMAVDAGASTEGLGTLMVHPHSYPGPAHITALAIQPSTLWVNKNGIRFADEALTFHYVECGNAINRQPGKCVFTLLDEAIKDKIAEEGVLTLGLRETGVFAGGKLRGVDKELQSQVQKGVKIAESWEEIARWLGTTPETLKATIEEYNGFSDRGYDATFGKDRRYLQALRKPPFYAIKCYLSFLTTLGGIKINERMEVLDGQDNPIPGLYAGGDTTGGWQGDTYCMPLSGSALGYAVNSGRIAAENAVNFALEK